MNLFRRALGASILLCGLLPGLLHAQSLRKLERNAINRTRITLVNGDTIQRFTTTLRRPSPKPDRFYYWQGQDHILRTVGAYNGHLLDGPYQLTDRTDRLLGAGTLKKGLKNGTWRKWRSDGSLLSSSRWRRGRQLGRTVTYDENSRPMRPPKAVAAAPASAQTPPLGHWWEPVYWKAKFKRRKKAVAAPTPAVSTPSPSPAPAPAPKRFRFFKGSKANATPKKAGA